MVAVEKLAWNWRQQIIYSILWYFNPEICIFHSFKFRVSNITLCNPWSRILIEKLTSFPLVKQFLSFYGTRRFITAFTSALTCPFPEPDQLHIFNSWYYLFQSTDFLLFYISVYSWSSLSHIFSKLNPLNISYNLPQTQFNIFLTQNLPGDFFPCV